MVRSVRVQWVKECEWCGDDFSNVHAMSKAEWKKRRYCSNQCARDATNDARRVEPMPTFDVLAFINRIRVIGYGYDPITH